MGDVFGGLAGAGSGAGAGRRELAALETVLDGAALWGLELDTRFRVLAGTFEPAAERYPWGEVADRRIQVLWFPVATILASLRREVDGERQLLSFGEEQLVDVVAALGGAPVAAPLFDQPEPTTGAWGPQFSLEGRSTAPDGTTRSITLRARTDELWFDLFARFDELELKDARGRDLALPTS